MPPKGEKSEAEVLREELNSLRGTLTAVQTELNAARTEKVQAELATMSEGERRLLAEETAADNAIASAKNEADALEGQIEGLMSEGKFKEVAGIQRKLARAENVILHEEGRKEYLAQQRESLKGQRTNKAQTPVPQVRTSNVDDRVQTWIDGHPRFKSWPDPKTGELQYADKSYHDAAMAGHYAALSRGQQPGTPDYFDTVEVHTGDRQAEREESPFSGANEELDYRVERPQQGAAGTGRAAAPPSRRALGSPSSTRAPDLSADEREAADGIMQHIADPGERYRRYAAARDARKARGATH